MGTIYGERKDERRKKLAYLAAGLIIIIALISAYYVMKPEPEEIITKNSEKMLGALELLSIEYEEAVENGKVVKESEYEGAKNVMNMIMDIFTQMKPYAMQVKPDLVESIERDIAVLNSMIYEKSSQDEVNQLIEKISRNLRRLQ